MMAGVPNVICAMLACKALWSRGASQLLACESLAAVRPGTALL